MTATAIDEQPAERMSEVESERVVLAAYLNAPDRFPNVRVQLKPDDFWDTRHALLFETMLAIEDAGLPVSPHSVLAALRDGKHLSRVGQGSYVHDLFGWPFVGPGVGYAIGRIRLYSRQRRQVALAQRQIQIASSPDMTPDDISDALAKVNVAMQAEIDEPADQAEIEGLDTWDDFFRRPQRPEDFVIPNLLDRQEVALILAAPGAGKSWLSRQIAIAVASGVHPFKPRVRIPIKRTLLMDLENPESTVQRQTADPAAAIRHLAGGNPMGDTGYIWTYPAGLNIRKRPDAELFERVIAETRPDLVCIGSLYNVFDRGRDDWDTAAEETKRVFNRVRARYGCAFWIEHHMPRATTEGHKPSPFGSTIWERWPSYGRVLQRIGGDAYELRQTFRGDREAGREFPAGLQRGGLLPWTPIWDEGELDLIKENFKP